jgi:hypothetical protein
MLEAEVLADILSSKYKRANSHSLNMGVSTFVFYEDGAR